MRWGWLCIVFGLAVLAAAAEDGEEATEDGGKYVVYKKTDYFDVDAYHIVQAGKFRDIVQKALRTNRAIRKAHASAKEAWEEDKTRAQGRFPLRMPRPIRVHRMSTYPTREKAEAAALKRQDKLDWRAEREGEREKSRLERRSESARKREQEVAATLRRAEQLFKRKLDQLLKEQEEKDKEADSDGETGEAEDRPD